MFNLSFSSTILRFYLMMLVAVVAVYISQSWLILVAFAVGVSAILGYRIEWGIAKTESKVVELPRAEKTTTRKAS